MALLGRLLAAVRGRGMEQGGMSDSFPYPVSRRLVLPLRPPWSLGKVWRESVVQDGMISVGSGSVQRSFAGTTTVAQNCVLGLSLLDLPLYKYGGGNLERLPMSRRPIKSKFASLCSQSPEGKILSCNRAEKDPEWSWPPRQFPHQIARTRVISRRRPNEDG